MHVLMTTDTVGGVWNHSRELAAGLLRRGFRITLVSFGGAASAAQLEWALATRRYNEGRFEYFESECRLEWMQDCEADLAASRVYLRELIAALHPDLLHSNQFCYGDLDVPVARVVAAHSDVLSWWQAAHGVAAPPLPWLERYRARVRAGLAAADRVVAPSGWMAAQLAAYDCEPQTVEVIWNGCDARRFHGGRPRAPRILTAGRLWDEGKNVAALSRLGLDVEVVVLGESQREGAGTAFSPGGNCRFTGRLAEESVRNWMETSAIYVVTSRYEPFGLAPLEAALSGCAIVANDLPSLREVWGDAIVYCDISDRPRLRALLTGMASDPEGCRQYAAQARRHAEARLGAERMVESYARLYAETRARMGAAA